MAIITGKEPSQKVKDRVAELGVCVALEGGPYDGWWFRHGEWEIRRTAVIHALANGQAVENNVTGYEPTEREAVSEIHEIEGARAVVWRWVA